MSLRWPSAVLGLGVAGVFCCPPAGAQPAGRSLAAVDVQRLANGVLGIMSYTVAPDVTMSSLAIDNAATGNPHLTMTQLGGGFTWSQDLPLYLEGNVAYARYDPVFLASEGADQRPVALKWGAMTATVGLGWDVPLAGHWTLRPMVNATYGRLTSDLKIVRWWAAGGVGQDLASIDHGTLTASGIGGSLVIDYERFAPDADVDLELRYTHVQLRNSGAMASDVDARASAESASVWARRRVPTGWRVWDRPVRYVLEGAYTRFLGSETEVGIDQMASLGAGVEFDSSAHDVWATRWRALVRYKFGPDTAGWSLGLALSF